MNPLDHLSEPIIVGCYIAYPARRGSRMWLQTMRVTGIEQTEDGYLLLGYTPDGRRTRTKNLQNVVVVQ